jgi:alkylation response protein AidB-like acyl-CoA dehydrogenase
MAYQYQPPLREMRFVIDEWLDAASTWREIPSWAELDSDMAAQVFEQAGRFVAERIAPLNQSGDQEGCHLVDGTVRTPAGFRQSYEAWVEAGWPTVAASAEFGGQDLPHLFEVAIQEMLASANHAWLMSPGLTHGAATCLMAHGSDELKARYLPKIVSGEWLTTMCLTEPQAGTDLGQIRSRARFEAAAGGYRITGSKIFISGGDHDLTDNIVHLVLARLPDAPTGTKGLSLFVVPKWLHAEDANRRAANGVTCDGLEKKMGIKASPTCAMNFDASLGWLVGEPNRGLAAMFVMMNSARLQVAMQGVAHAESAWQQARAYASERVQSRPVSVPEAMRAERESGLPIALHPAIRRILFDLKVMVEAARSIGYWIAHWIDIAHRHPDADRRAKADALAALLTPVAKAFFTTQGFHAASQALQVFGGYGYLRDYGIEQTLRDSRISMLYEGTNEVQAIDLVTRKIIADNGARLDLLIAELKAESERCEHAGAEAAQAGATLARLCGETRALAQQVMAAASRDAQRAHGIAGDFLNLCGWLLIAFAWIRTLRIVLAAADQRDSFHEGKLAAARYFLSYRLHEFETAKRVVESGLMADLPYLFLDAT